MRENGEFGEKLKGLRSAKKIKQESLAKTIGIDITYLSKIENGLMPGDGTARKIIKVLDNGGGELERLYVIKLLGDFERKVKATKFYSRIKKNLTVIKKNLKENR